MAETNRREGPLDALDILVGEWTMTASFAPDPADAPRARTSFEWLKGKRLLVQRWEVEHPDAPDGIAILGLDTGETNLLQHYFDSRGVARVYEMSFADNIWTLERHASAPDFSHRFIGTFSDDCNSIAGPGESSSDGSSWKPDFDLTYRRVLKKGDCACEYETEGQC